MMNRLKTLLLTLSFTGLLVAPMVVIASPQASYAKAPSSISDCEVGILGMPPWFRGLTEIKSNNAGVNECVIVSPNAVGGLSNFIWKVVLNVIEIGLFIAGYVAIFFILFGGFQFLTGGSNPSQIEKARKTILNAVIGLAISMASIGITNLIFRVING